ncbi:MAG: hypothetical protein K9M75_09275 [Phycisphaerae bacterium]|nr:hypothetical protein [Phycisphaerae bacterium]
MRSFTVFVFVSMTLCLFNVSIYGQGIGEGLYSQLLGYDAQIAEQKPIPFVEWQLDGSKIANSDDMIELEIASASGNKFIFGIPTKIKKVIVSQFKNDLKDHGLVIEAPGFRFTSVLENQPKSNIRLVIEDMISLSSDGESFKVLVTALKKSGLSSKDAVELIEKTKKKLLQYSDESLQKNILSSDIDDLEKIKDVQAAVEQALLAVVRSEVWTAYVDVSHFHFNGRKIYIFNQNFNSKNGRFRYVFKEYDESGKYMYYGTLVVLSSSKGKDELGVLRGMLQFSVMKKGK